MLNTNLYASLSELLNVILVLTYVIALTPSTASPHPKVLASRHWRDGAHYSQAETVSGAPVTWQTAPRLQEDH